MAERKQGAIQKELQHQEEGAVARYRRVVTGRPGYRALLLYETAAMAISPLPGSLGIRMRRLFMPLLFEEFGRRVTMARDVSFRKADRISIGSNVFIDSGAVLDVKTTAGRIVVLNDVHIGRHTIISCPGGTVTIGEGTRIGDSCRLGSLEGLTIGRNCLLENFVCLVGAGHEFSATGLPILRQPLTCKGPTTIGDNVKIGRKATVLDGVSIGSGATIGPGSLVNRNIAKGAMVAGIPAA